MADGNFPVEGAQLVAIRGIILKYVSALTNWMKIKDRFIHPERVTDNLHVTRILEADEPKHSRAILTTLQIWKSTLGEQATLNNLIGLLQGFPVDDLIAKLSERETQLQIRGVGKKGGITYREQDPRFTVSNFQISSSASEVALTICADADAVKVWSTVKDVMVKVVTDNLNVDKYLDDKKQYEAVLQSVQTWCSQQSDRATLHSLLGILRDHGLRDLTEKLRSKEVVNTLRHLEGKGPDPGYAPPPKVEKMDCDGD